jgi:hypothetical protein
MHDCLPAKHVRTVRALLPLLLLLLLLLLIVRFLSRPIFF